LSSRWTADDHLKEVSQQSRIFLGTPYVKPLRDLFTLGIKKKIWSPCCERSSPQKQFAPNQEKIVSMYKQKKQFAINFTVQKPTNEKKRKSKFNLQIKGKVFQV